MEQLDADLRIRDIFAREIYDCEGNPTVETEVLAGDGIVGRVSVPSGVTRGACDRKEKKRLTEKTVETINTHIAQEMIGRNVFDQKEIDRTLLCLDGTEDKRALGAQAVFGVSAAAASAAAAALKLPLYRYLGGVQAKSLPVPVVNAASRESRVGNRTATGRIRLVPSEHLTFREQMEMCIEIIRMTGALSADIREAFDKIRSAAGQAGFRAGEDVTFALAADASGLYDSERKCYRFPEESRLKGQEICRTTQEMIEYYEELVTEFPVSSIEDPLDCEDWSGWMQMTERLGSRVQLAGDSLFGSDIRRLEKGIDLGAANAVVVRAGQAGTLTELSDVIKNARGAGYKVMMAHHTGETADSLTADLAVAFYAGYIAGGFPCHMENVEKYNRLLRIGERIGESN